MIKSSSVELVKCETVNDSLEAKPIGYTVTGILLSDIKVGKSINLFRTSRNGELIQGHFLSSPIIQIKSFKDGYFLHTENSIYFLKVIDTASKLGDAQYVH